MNYELDERPLIVAAIKTPLDTAQQDVSSYSDTHKIITGAYKPALPFNELFAASSAPT
jgi:hypothetical protein